MRLVDAFLLAWRVAATHRVRFSLSVLGVIIGVATVVIVMAVGHAGERHIREELATFGENAVWIWRDPEQRQTLRHVFELNPYEISQEDLPFLQASIPEIVQLDGVLTTSEELAVSGVTKQVDVVGIGNAFFSLNNERLQWGRALLPIEVEAGDRVAVISDSMRTFLIDRFGTLPRQIALNGEPFLLVGALAKKDRPFINLLRARGGETYEVFIPVQIPQRWLGTNHLSYLQCQPLPGTSGKVAQRAVNLLKIRHRGVPHFHIESMAQYLHVSQQVLGIVRTLLTVAALLALVVGGIGIMNIMIVSVTERTKEIGIRKAVGATHRAILLQFLTEAVLITFLGGVCGVWVAVFGVWLVYSISSLDGLFYGPSVVWSLGISILVGLLAGLYPAWRAARLDPATALRAE